MARPRARAGYYNTVAAALAAGLLALAAAAVWFRPAPAAGHVQAAPAPPQREALRMREAALGAREAGLRTREEELKRRAAQLAEQEQRRQEAAAGVAAANKAAKERERDYKYLWEDALADLKRDAQVLRAYLDANATQLEHARRGRPAGLRRRGVVISAGGAASLANAFVSLHVLRRHLNCTLPGAIM